MLTKLAIKIAAPLPQLENYDRYLFIGPHPDDIEIGAGASVARLCAQGKDVRYLICTDGRFGFDHISGVAPEEVKEIRREETKKAAAFLGVKEVKFLDLCDGGFYTKEELLQGILQTIGEWQPQAVFVTDPDVSSECHVDHRNAGECAKEACLFCENAEIAKRYEAKTAVVEALAFYMTAKPDRYIGVRGYRAKQLSAVFDFHVSQYPPDCDANATLQLYLRLRALEYGIRSFKGEAEGFRVLGRIHRHCLPEAGK